MEIKNREWVWKMNWPAKELNDIEVHAKVALAWEKFAPIKEQVIKAAF
jgi:hypothetical protein